VQIYFSFSDVDAFVIFDSTPSSVLARLFAARGCGAGLSAEADGGDLFVSEHLLQWWKFFGNSLNSALDLAIILDLVGVFRDLLVEEEDWNSGGVDSRRGG